MFIKATKIAATAIALVASGAQASSLFPEYSSLVTFGDSLSDLGKANLFTGGTSAPAPFYIGGQFSNGPNWADIIDNDFATPTVPGLGVSLPSVPENTYPFNFAVGGATATGAGPTDLSAQIATLDTVVTNFGSSVLGARPLGVIFIGGNDIGNVTQIAAGTAALEIAAATSLAEALAAQAKAQATVIAGAQAAANKVRASVLELGDRGIADIVVVNSTDVGATPLIRSFGPEAAGLASLATATFNTTLSAKITMFDSSKLKQVSLFDFAGLTAAITLDPASFGFDNITDACLTAAGVCADPEKFAFWDPFHPTAAAHRLVADGFRASVGNNALLSPVPLPAAAWGLLLGVAAFGAVGARRARRAA